MSTTTKPVESQRVRALISYPVPLDDVTARLFLPRDLTLAEAGRIYAVMKSLCVDLPKQD